MKKLRFIAFALITILFCAGITACGDDDKDKDEPKATDKTESNSIVGTWTGIETDGYDTYAISMTLNSNGSFCIVELADNDYYTGTYTYTGSMLILQYSDGDVWAFNVIWNSNNSIILDDGHGERITLSRQ